MKKSLPKIIKCARITLKILAISFKNAEKIFKEIDKNREHLEKWLEWTPLTQRPEDSFSYLQKLNEEFNASKAGHYGIFLKNKYIGNIGIFDLDFNNKTGEIGYWLAKDKTGNGYMKEAVTALEESYFSLGLIKIYIKCDADNEASKKVALSCGYKQEALLENDSIITFGSKKEEIRNTLNYAKTKYRH
jgi:ribosomal-protein-serine acetyltransferase